MFHDFRFIKEGYFPAHVYFEGSEGNGDAVEIDRPPNDPNHWIAHQLVERRDNLISVPMYRDTTAVADYFPIWREVKMVPAEILAHAENWAKWEAPFIGGTWKPGTFDVLAFRNQYGDYRIFFIRFRSRELGYVVGFFRVIPPGDVTGSLNSGVHPPTTTGSAVREIPQLLGE